MTKQAWLCPSCQKHHAPHVETCPGNAPIQPLYNPLPYPGWHERVGTVPDMCAGCKGACGNVACPRLARVTSGSVTFKTNPNSWTEN